MVAQAAVKAEARFFDVVTYTSRWLVIKKGVKKHGGFLSHRGTPSHHPLKSGIFPDINHLFLSTPMTMESSYFYYLTYWGLLLPIIRIPINQYNRMEAGLDEDIMGYITYLGVHFGWFLWVEPWWKKTQVGISPLSSLEEQPHFG